MKKKVVEGRGVDWNGGWESAGNGSRDSEEGGSREVWDKEVRGW